MKGLQIKCELFGSVGMVEFLDENDLVLMECKWVGERVNHKETTSIHTAEMMKIAESIRDLAMKIGE